VTDQTLLVLTDIRKSFGGVEILKGISLDVRAGEFLTLLGPSGCGKTTTLRVIAGFETADSGEVQLEGRSVAHLAPYERDLHTVFQHYALFPHYNVFENVAFPLRVERLPEAEIRTRVAQALALVKLEGMGDRTPDQLSGGQQQRVALARALVGRPPLLLLDEPLGALDLKLRKDMQLELKRIQRELNIAFVYVTHDQEEALTMSDRIAVFNAGNIEQVGTPREIYDNPATQFVADFIGAANILDAKVTRQGASDLELLVEGEVAITLPWVGAAPAAGTSLKIAVRPEQVRIAADRASAPVGSVLIESKLLESVYLGSATHLLVSPFAKSSRVVTAVWLNLEKKSSFEAGQKLLLQIQPRNIRLLQN